MELNIENLSNMTLDQAKRFFDQFEHQLDNDTGEAAKEHLAAGFPIYYENPGYPKQMIKEYPGGKREIVNFDMTPGEEVFIQEL